MRPLIALVLFTAIARADATVPADAKGPPLRCADSDRAYERDARSERVARAQSIAGAGFTFAQAAAHYVLFHQAWPTGRPGLSVVVDLDGRRALEFPEGAEGLVEDAAGRLVGVLSIDMGRSELRLVDAADRVRWRAGVTDIWFDSAVAVIAGRQLIVATFRRFATGSALHSYDLATGRLLWTGKVEQVNAAHSEYFNDVTVELAGDRVVLRGIESSGCYVQTFDAATGRRLSSRMKRRF
ncbi:MAG TPA: PQQ-binding-like beta-propeller repeat protein [Polyangia bacterium]|nr:PQQ-binding-like beta-propeller repeat protein [Polyangia bacterium]